MKNKKFIKVAEGNNLIVAIFFSLLNILVSILFTFSISKNWFFITLFLGTYLGLFTIISVAYAISYLEDREVYWVEK